MKKLEEFFQLAKKQLSNFYIISSDDMQLLDKYYEKITERMLHNCRHINNKYYSDINKLSPYHSCQYLMFLYFAANTIFNETGERQPICDKLYNLSKIVSSADIYYEIQLPEIFTFDHPVGTVLGRADYGDYFCFSQGVTIGNNKGIYPSFGNFVMMHSNSKVLGNSKIGNKVIISANTYIKDTDVPDNSIVFGQDRNLVIKPLKSAQKTLFDLSGGGYSVLCMIEKLQKCFCYFVTKYLYCLSF